MYSLLLLLTLASLWLLAKLTGSARDGRERPPRQLGRPPDSTRRASAKLFLALGLVNLLLVYTHYYGWLVVACEAAFLLLRDRRKLPRFLLTVAALALLFAPWAAACVKAAGEGGGLAQNLGWIERPGCRIMYQRVGSGPPLRLCGAKLRLPITATRADPNSPKCAPSRRNSSG